jgi:hypothetical protein
VHISSITSWSLELFRQRFAAPCRMGLRPAHFDVTIYPSSPNEVGITPAFTCKFKGIYMRFIQSHNTANRRASASAQHGEKWRKVEVVTFVIGQLRQFEQSDRYTPERKGSHVFSFTLISRAFSFGLGW